MMMITMRLTALILTLRWLVDFTCR